MKDDKKLRIGLFTDIYYPSISGVVIAVENLKKALEKYENCKVFIITVNSFPKNNKYIKKDDVIRIPGLPINVYDYKIRITYPVKAVKMIKDLHLDLIHSNTEFGIGMFAKSMAKKLDIPMVHTYHSLYEQNLDTMLDHFTSKVTKSILKSFMKVYFSKTIKEVIVPSLKTKNNIIRNYKVKHNISIIPSGIDTDKFNITNIKKSKLKEIKKKYNIKDDDFVSLFVGRIGKEKNIDFLIESYANVVKKYKNAKLLIVGTGPLEEELKNLAKKLNILDNCIFTGKVEYKDIPIFYNISNVLLTASHYETQGLTLMEAFASSKPVLCINDESFIDVVINNYNGYIFKNKSELTQLILKLIENKRLLENLENNAKISSNDYSLSCFASKVKDVYKKALKEYTIKNGKNTSN